MITLSPSNYENQQALSSLLIGENWGGVDRACVPSPQPSPTKRLFRKSVRPECIEGRTAKYDTASKEEGDNRVIFQLPISDVRITKQKVLNVKSW